MNKIQRHFFHNTPTNLLFATINSFFNHFSCFLIYGDDFKLLRYAIKTDLKFSSNSSILILK